jgi:hypothetical protein
MFDIIQREVATSDLKEVVSKLIPDSMSLDIQASSNETIVFLFVTNLTNIVLAVLLSFS